MQTQAEAPRNPDNEARELTAFRPGELQAAEIARAPGTSDRKTQE